MFKKYKNIKKASKPSSGRLRKNRNGIDVFDSNTDLYALFSEKEAVIGNPDAKIMCSETVDSEIMEIETADADIMETETADTDIMETETTDADITDIEITDADIADIEITDADIADIENSAGLVRISGNSLNDLRKDKHGLPFLDGSGSLSTFFRDETMESGEEEFSELLEASLKGRDSASIMRDKRDGTKPAPLPLKQRLKRYPSPQKNLDLHGYTANEARSRVEFWLRGLWRNGFFTVRIIVGRGIHSEFGAVLPDVVEDILIKLKREGVLLWFEWDRKHKSQSGAVIGYLKQFD